MCVLVDSGLELITSGNSAVHTGLSVGERQIQQGAGALGPDRGRTHQCVGSGEHLRAGGHGEWEQFGREDVRRPEGRVKPRSHI